MEDDLTEYELQKKLQSLNKNFAKNINASLRGSTDEFVPLVIPAFQHGGRLFVSHPIGAGEGEFEGGNFMDFINKVKDVVSLPLKLATMPLQMIKSAVMGSGECEEKIKCKSTTKKSCKMDGKTTINAPVDCTKNEIDSGKSCSSKKPCKARAKKGGNLLSTLSDLANIMPSVFPTEMDNWIPPEITRGIAKKIAEKASGGAKKIRKANPWLEYVKQVKEKHPDLKYKDVLVLAKISYHSAK